MSQGCCWVSGPALTSFSPDFFYSLSWQSDGPPQPAPPPLLSIDTWSGGATQVENRRDWYGIEKMVLNGRGPRAVLGCIETVACCLPPSSLPFIDQVVPVQQKELERNNGIHLWYHDITVFYQTTKLCYQLKILLPFRVFSMSTTSCHSTVNQTCRTECQQRIVVMLGSPTHLASHRHA